MVQVKGIDDASVVTANEQPESREVRYACNLLEPVFLTSDVLRKCGVLPSERDRFEIELPACEYDEMFGNSKQFVFIKRMVPEKDQAFRLQKIYPPAIRYSTRSTPVSVMSLYEHIRSLHQLQNLYYDMTGEEMEVAI
ncbi:MAG: hypothetical protein EOP49_37795 [Sphingobacteriales bacterium]|nr:MAG: hypothetical protein EOP49_37795 [Sphingobacteriales bacterium]